MIVIRTAEDMARALDSPLSPEVRRLLTEHWQRLAEFRDYELSDLAMFVIVQPADTLEEVEAVCELGLPEVLRTGGEPFSALTPETIEQHDGVIELVFIFSDDGFGLVLLVQLEPGTDRRLIHACRHYLEGLGPECASRSG